MYISRIVIRNFRNFRKLDVKLNSGVTCIVGENNTGKTNLLHAIRLPIDASLSSQYRTLLPSDFPSGLDYRKPQQVLISLELRNFAGKENEEAMVAAWAIDDNVARITYRFRPKRGVIEAIENGERPDTDLTLDHYHYQIVGAGGDIDPITINWNEDFGQSIRFDELQQFMVFVLPPLRDVEQSLRSRRYSPLVKLLTASEISEEEQANLVRILSEANDNIARSTTISQVGENVDKSFSEAAGTAFRMQVEIGMASPTFKDISQSLTVLLSNKCLNRFDPSLNGLGLNNVLYVSMLLRFFEERIAKGNTPGQLLLFEEPEAHLHPQLQRVLFSTLVNKPFQTIATTHSTHITSSVPLNAIVVLTDDGTPSTASSVPAITTGLTNKQILDLERYLDATRGVLLYARKVILVEGPAELFLIPPLVKAVLNVNLEEHGISVIPIFGVHFEVYAKLFGPNGITKKCAIVADGDLQPSDATGNADLVPNELPDLVRPNLTELENDFVKVFACETTFEREVTDAGTVSMLAEACKELSANIIADRLTVLLGEDLKTESLNMARDMVLATAKRFGKARFAQVASKYASLASVLPTYINDAINWLLENEAE